MERWKTIFSNPVSQGTIRKAERAKKKYIKKFGDDTNCSYGYQLEDNEILGPFFGVRNIQVGNHSENRVSGETLDREKGILIGNIRMGFGHYRISMAMASAAHAMGYTPYWFDLHAYQETTGGKVIAYLNKLYSMGSRWSQKYPLFNQLFWEPISAKGFKKLSYNAVDQKVSELMIPACSTLPKDMPFIATHVWPAQAAVHAGFTKVVNAIPDNWPMGLHLAEGAIHTVQTPSAFLGYKTLKGMSGEGILNPIPRGELFETGHYVDHELVTNLETDCKSRVDRIKADKTLRILLTVGGAGAQGEMYAKIIRHLLPKVHENKVALLINVGDHKDVWDQLTREIPDIAKEAVTYFDAWDETCAFANKALVEEVQGIHVFYHQDIFAAVYSTNLLMRPCDFMVTKPSELAFYPVPKLMLKRLGGHEAWGAIRAAELGDGTIECETVERTLQMLDLMLTEPEILESMNAHILKANQAGVYDGAYEVVKLAQNIFC
jgi:hypothetical protein